MTVAALIFLAALVSGALSQKSCTDHDCNCNDVNGGVCTIPEAASAFHVNTMEECIENCDLFGPFDMCDWLMFYPPAMNPGVDENCRLIVNPTETMEDYLSTCRYLGQPIFFKPEIGADGIIDGECMPNALEGVGTGTCTPACKGAGGTCHDCSGTNCAGYAETQCTFTDDPSGESEPLVSYDLCHASCSLKATQGGNNFAYFKFDKESQECTCEHQGNVKCSVQIIKFGVSASGITTCSIDGPTPSKCSSDADCLDASQPKCDVPSGECVQCISDSDCPNAADDPNENLCDLVPHTCVAGCRIDEDCATQDYCKKESHDDEIGSCSLGCRNPGSPCDPGTGSLSGTCSGNHICEVGGSVYITGIEVQTASCVGCSSRALAGASITLTAIVPNAGEKSCATSILDVPSRIDYPSGGGNVLFDFPDTLDTCYLFHSENDVTAFSVTWSGPGTWTPETFKINWHENSPRCCKNMVGTTLTDGNSANFDCDRC